MSVVVLCYNHDAYVDAALRSIEAQDVPPFEVVIIDDGSEDGSRAQIEQFIAATPHLSIRAIFHEENRGVTASLNEALSWCSGDFIALLASDDRWHRNKLGRQLAAVREAGLTRTVACFADMAMIDADGNDLGRTFNNWVRSTFLPDLDKVVVQAAGDFTKTLLDRGNFLAAPTALVRREAIQAAGGFDPRLRHEDYDMWVRLSLRGHFVWLDEVLADYRVLASSLSAKSGIGFLEDDVRTFAKLRWTRPDLALRAWRAGVRALRRAEREHYPRMAELHTAARAMFGASYWLVARMARARGRDLVSTDHHLPDPRD